MKDRSQPERLASLRLDERLSPVLTTLRALMPDRPLSRLEAFSVAERQSLRLAQLLVVPVGAVSSDTIASSFASWTIEYDANLPTSGMTTWHGSRQTWLTLINASEPTTRQRFSVAHELKHLIDHPSLFFSYLESDGSRWKQEDIELVCDYFAGCLLMPRPAVKRAFVGGLQDVDRLADHFLVSSAAMRVRLGQLNLRSPVSLREAAADLHPTPDVYGRSRSKRTEGATMQDAISGLGQPRYQRSARQAATHSSTDHVCAPSPRPADRMTMATPIGVRS